MAAPEEIVAAPLTVYLAPVGTAMPVIDVAPASPWAKLGVAGDRNYDEAGVTVTHSEEVFDFKPAGSTMPVKRFRTGENLEIKLSLVDLSPDTYAQMMNGATLTTAAGPPAEKHFDMFRGDQINSFAVLARGLSPVDNTLAMQYEIPIAFVSVNGDAVFNKGKPVSLPVSILAVVHQSPADDPICRIQTA